MGADDGAPAGRTTPGGPRRAPPDGWSSAPALRAPLTGPGDAPDGTAAPARPRHARAAFLLVPALLLGGLSVVLADRQEHAREDVVATLTGGVRSLPRPVAERWRAERDGAPSVAVAGGLVVEVGARLVARDARTGAVRWSVDPPGPALVCPPAVGGTADAGTGTPGPLLVCVSRHGEDVPGRGAVRDVRAHVLDPGTGREARSWPLPSDEVVRVGPADLGVATVRADGVEISRYDARTGALRWSVRPPTGRAIASRLHREVDLAAVGEVLVVRGWGALVAVGPDGRRVGDDDLVAVAPLADGGWATTAAGTGVSVLHGPDGAVRATVPGVVAHPLLDDGTSADVVVTQAAGRVRGADARTGEERWSLPVAGRGDHVRLLSLVVVVAGDRLVALDARTGERRWDAPLPGGARWPPLTDGDSLLLVVTGPTARLVSVAAGAGYTEWDVPLPGGTVDVVTAGGGLVVVTVDALVGLA